MSKLMAPPGWVQRSLGEVGQITTGMTPQANDPSNFGDQIPFVGPSDLGKQRWISTSSSFLSEKGARQSRLVTRGAVLVSCIGSILGKVSQAAKWTAFNQQINAIEANEDIDSDFLYYACTRLSESLNRLAGLQAVPIVNKSSFSKLEIKVPASKSEQKKIAQILDTLDTQIRQTEGLIAKLERIKQGLLTDLLTRGIDQNGQLRPTPDQAPHLYKDSPLGRIPTEWRVTTLRSYLSAAPKNGYSPQEVGSFMGKIMLGLGCVTPSGFKPIQLKNAPKNDPQIERALLNDRDLLITRANTRELVGLVGLYRDIGYPCSYPDLMMKLTPAPGTSAEFLELVLRSSPLRKQIQAAASGTSESMVKISGTTVSGLFVKMPQQGEQSRILDAVAPASKRLRSEADTLGTLKQTKHGLMDDLLTGRVRVTPLLKTAELAHG